MTKNINDNQDWLHGIVKDVENKWLSLYRSISEEVLELEIFTRDYDYMAKSTILNGHKLLASLKKEAPLFAIKQEEFINRLEKDNIEHSQLISRLSVVYLVSILEACLRDTVRSLLLINKNPLKNEHRKLNTKEIIEFGNIDNLIHSLIDDELYGFSKRSFKQQADYLKNHFDIDLFKSNVDVVRIDELKATRNLIIHNKGLVDQRYLDTVSKSSFELNDIRTIDSEYLASSINNVKQIIRFINKQGFSKSLDILSKDKLKDRK